MRFEELSGVTFQQLEVFMAAAKYESFSRTAEDLHMTTASVSRNIRALEQMLGITLFVSQKQRVHLTAAGEQLARELQSISRRFSHAIRKARDTQQTENSVLIIGDGNAVPNSVYLLPVLKRFEKDHPDIRVQVMRDEPSRVIDGLIDRTYDVIFAMSFAKQIEKTRVFRFEPILPFTPKILVSKEHPFFGKDSLTEEEICSQTVVVLDGGNYAGYRNAVEEILHAIHYPMKKIVPVQDATSLSLSLLRGGAIAIASPLYAQVDSLYYRYLDLPACNASWNLCLAYLPDNSNPNVKKLIASGKAAFRS